MRLERWSCEGGRRGLCAARKRDVLDSAAAVAALVAKLIEGDVEFIFSQFVALRRVRQC
jgi:hypothetical protein